MVIHGLVGFIPAMEDSYTAQWGSHKTGSCFVLRLHSEDDTMDYHRLYVILSGVQTVQSFNYSTWPSMGGRHWLITWIISSETPQCGSSKGSHWILIILINVEHLNTQVRQVIYEIFTSLGRVAEVDSLEITSLSWFYDENHNQRKTLTQNYSLILKKTHTLVTHNLHLGMLQTRETGCTVKVSFLPEKKKTKQKCNILHSPFQLHNYTQTARTERAHGKHMVIFCFSFQRERRQSTEKREWNIARFQHPPIINLD